MARGWVGEGVGGLDSVGLLGGGFLLQLGLLPLCPIKSLQQLCPSSPEGQAWSVVGAQVGCVFG